MSVVPCTSTPVVHGIVVFDPTAFKTAWPEFSTIPDAVLVKNFANATLQLSNSCCSRVKDANVRELLLDLLTAHITFLLNGANGIPAPGIVGRIASATEGSVSVGADFSGPDEAQFYLQTKYGADYWAATARWRQMVYIPGRSNSDVPGPYGFGFWGGGNGFC